MKQDGNVLPALLHNYASSVPRRGVGYAHFLHLVRISPGAHVPPDHQRGPKSHHADKFLHALPPW